ERTAGGDLGTPLLLGLAPLDGDLLEHAVLVDLLGDPDRAPVRLSAHGRVEEHVGPAHSRCGVLVQARDSEGAAVDLLVIRDACPDHSVGPGEQGPVNWSV